MLCTKGSELLHIYEVAVQNRAEAQNQQLLKREHSDVGEELLFSSKLKYSQAFVAWVAHRGICTTCRTTSLKDDLTQFASV